jgi:hypothetical protein
MASSSTPPARGREIDPEHYGPGLFTEAELAAADQLVQLSDSFGWNEASSSSLLSVNTGAVVWKEKEVVEELDRRARKRYRLLSELYAATGPAARSRLGADTTIPSARKRKRLVG